MEEEEEAKGEKEEEEGAAGIEVSPDCVVDGVFRKCDIIGEAVGEAMEDEGKGVSLAGEEEEEEKEEEEASIRFVAPLFGGRDENGRNRLIFCFGCDNVENNGNGFDRVKENDSGGLSMYRRLTAEVKENDSGGLTAEVEC